jgi:hypothetical protein
MRCLLSAETALKYEEVIGDRVRRIGKERLGALSSFDLSRQRHIKPICARIRVTVRAAINMLKEMQSRINGREC